jgi:TolB protein
MSKRAEYVWAALAAVAALAACAGIVLAPLTHNVVHAQGVGLSEYMYITFEDDFENPAWTACNWMYSEAACNVVADAGNKLMALRDVEPASHEPPLPWVCPVRGRSFLTDNFLIRTRLRINPGPTTKPWYNHAGIAWAGQFDSAYSCYWAGLAVAPGYPDQEGVGLCVRVGDEDVTLAAYPTPIGFDVWHELEVRSSGATYEVWLDGVKVIEAPHTPHYASGGVCIWADHSADFDEFHMEARPANPGKLAYIRFDWQSMDSIDVYTMDADGTNEVRITHDPGYIWGSNGGGCWAPDGTRLAGYCERISPPASLGIYVMDADGSNRVNISAVAGDPLSDCEPAWSPDGRWIAFRTRRDGNSEIYKMHPDGTSPVNLTNNPASDYQPAWSPDATKIAFRSRRSGDSDIWVMNADGSDPQNLSNAPGSWEADPAWSPDGNKIAFISDRAGSDQVFVMNADGSDQRQLTSFPGETGAPEWSPDGSKIAFTSGVEDPLSPLEYWYAIHVMNPDGTNCVQITPDNDIYGYNAWHPLEPQYPRQVSIPSVWGTPGLAVAVPIYVTPVRDVCGIQIDLRYDPTLLSPVDVTPGELISSLPGWEIATHFDSGRAQAIVYNSLATPVYGGSGPIMYVNFLVNPAAANGASCALDLRNVILADASGNALPIDAVWDGLFTVSALHHFAFDTIPSPQGADPVNPLPFPVHIRALDESDQLCIAYNGLVDLSDLLVGPLGTVAFLGGEWAGDIALYASEGRLGDVITATDPLIGAAGQSNPFNVTVKGSANGDQEVNVLDIMKTVNIILGYITPAPWQFWAADMNSDGVVNVQDIILIINKIFSASGMGKPVVLSAAARSAGPVTVTVEPARGGAWAIRVSNAVGVAGAQFEIACKQGEVAAGELAVAAGWQVQSNWISGHLRVVAFSPSATGLTAGEGTLLCLSNTRGKPKLVSTLLCDAAGQEIAVR